MKDSIITHLRDNWNPENPAFKAKILEFLTSKLREDLSNLDKISSDFNSLAYTFEDLCNEVDLQEKYDTIAKLLKDKLPENKTAFVIELVSTPVNSIVLIELASKAGKVLIRSQILPHSVISHVIHPLDLSRLTDHRILNELIEILYREDSRKGLSNEETN